MIEAYLGEDVLAPMSMLTIIGAALGLRQDRGAARCGPRQLRRDRSSRSFGANGAGKTTLLKTISGLLRPSAGSIDFESASLVRRAGP